MSNTKTPPSIQIFKVGTHADFNSSDDITFSESDIAATVAAYDPKKHEAPLVIGHPKAGAPAFGWVSSLSGNIEAQTHQVEANFAEDVNNGRYKKISSSFYRPDSPFNPVPGTWYLRHVGFFGAQPVSVKGMRDASFAEGESAADFVEFGESIGSWGMARFLRGMREFLIEKFGTETADQVVPNYLAEEAEEVSRTDDSDFAEPTPTKKTKSQESSVEDKDKSVGFAERETKLAANEAAFKEREQALADKEAKQNNADFIAFAEANAAKTLPRNKNMVVAIMQNLSGEGVANFAEGDKEQSPLDAFKALIEELPDQVDFAEHSADNDEATNSVSFASPEGYQVDATQADLHAKASAYAQANNVEYVTAVKAVGGK